MPRYSNTERIGLNAVESVVLRDFGWIFREQPVVDMGIDAHVELVDAGNPHGRLIALQIKSGAGNFKEESDGFVFYGSLVHLKYWLGHSLPVLLVAHIPESGELYWVPIEKDTIELTSTRWKVKVPKSNIFNRTSKDRIEKYFDGPTSHQRLRKLSIDEPLMRHVLRGGRVCVELEEWVNKSLGRTPVKIVIVDEDGREEIAREWFQYYVGYRIGELVVKLFPWCSPKVDIEYYDEHYDYDQPLSERLWCEDEEGAEVPFCSDELFPYTEAAGEVEYYRLQLGVNDLGKAFLLVSDYIQGAP